MDTEQQEDELLALHSIFDSEEFVRDEPKAAGEIRVSVELSADFIVALKQGATLRPYQISFLPPLHLTFELPKDYPSSSPPAFSLTCSWLTHTQLTALHAQLSDLYQATGGAVVLFTWVQFLKEDALRFLGIHTLLELPSDEDSTDQEASRSSAPCEPDLSAPSLEEDYPKTTDSPVALDQQGAASPLIHPKAEDQTPTLSQSLLSQLLVYDATQQQKQFASTAFDCGVCLMSCLGSDCVRLPECGHIFCRSCLAHFCKLQITEGKVKGVTCLQADCSSTPTPAQVKSLVGEELFSRFDRLLLQNTLDCMPDVVYCPRPSCGSAFIQEESTTAAMCCVCTFVFCVNCRKTYHGKNKCQGQKDKSEEMDIQQGSADLPQTQVGLTALWDDYASGSKKRQHFLESRYGRKALQVKVEGYLSDDWIAANSRNCPYCFCRIQKDQGCNQMTCSQCRRYFCWACLAKLPDLLTSVLHFKDGTCPQYN